MIAVFVSQCEKQAIIRTSRVLDSFANRIGDRTWKTIITEDGLVAVKHLLKKSASKNTAVACHIIHGTTDIQLAWIVGKRSAFDVHGIIPISHTSQEIVNTQYENTWVYLPLIKIFVALAGLFHDFGKSSLSFQQKLSKKSTQTNEMYRHEFISCLYLVGLEQTYDYQPLKMLNAIVANQVNFDSIIKTITPLSYENKPMMRVSDFTFCIVWLVLSHHKIPTPTQNLGNWKGVERGNLTDLKNMVECTWGYCIQENPRIQITFPKDLPSQNAIWMKQLKKWASKAMDLYPMFERACEKGVIRSLLQYSRLGLNFGDHFYSSQPHDPKWVPSTTLYANTDESGNLKQFLDEHLVGVTKEALSMAAALPKFERVSERASDISILKKRNGSASPFVWQDKAVDAINVWKQSFGLSTKAEDSFGFFGVNVASTGCGKTFANAKIMRALSSDGESLRYILGIGLRTLTLQTGDEYRTRIGLDDTELAVLIGSKAVETLHELDTMQEGVHRQGESAQELLDGYVDFSRPLQENALAFLVHGDSAKALLFAPVLACTIDYMMLATEVVRGGKWMLPFLRLMSSDLVIDEIDDFTDSDSIAIGRLIHLAGVLGRKVLISSATIPPDMATGYYRLYQDGYKQYLNFHELSGTQIACGWFDEFRSAVVSIDSTESFSKSHEKFCIKRIENIMDFERIHGARRKGAIVKCEDIITLSGYEERKQAYFERILDEIKNQHTMQRYRDRETGKEISFGCVRVAHINECIELFGFLSERGELPDSELRVMPYHSRQILLLRSLQEKHLDQVLRCKDGSREQALSHPIIRNHISHCSKPNIIFVLVCTPVEEIGRDHDFDWAIVEPSSYRSIIQLAGRVRRHRKEHCANPNISIMQYNIRALNPTWNGPVFTRPGYESYSYRLNSKDIEELVNVHQISESINSCPRISVPLHLQPESQLQDIEHFVIKKQLNDSTQKGPESPGGWMQPSIWSLTGIPQRLAPFRQDTQKTTMFIRMFDGESRPFFALEDSPNQSAEKVFGIKTVSEAERQGVRKYLWLERDYEDAMIDLHEKVGSSFKECSIIFGEIEVPGEGPFLYWDQFGMKSM